MTAVGLEVELVLAAEFAVPETELVASIISENLL